jgi:hypothetical protein
MTRKMMQIWRISAIVYGHIVTGTFDGVHCLKTPFFWHLDMPPSSGETEKGKNLLWGLLEGTSFSTVLGVETGFACSTWRQAGPATKLLQVSKQKQWTLPKIAVTTTALGSEGYGKRKTLRSHWNSPDLPPSSQRKCSKNQQKLRFAYRN